MLNLANETGIGMETNLPALPRGRKKICKYIFSIYKIFGNTAVRSRKAEGILSFCDPPLHWLKLQIAFLWSK